MVDLYLTDDAHARSQAAVPVPRRELLLHDRDDRRAGDLPRRLVDDRGSARRRRSTVSRAGDFAAYYIVWTLVRNMNIVFTPYGWEERIREGELSAPLLRPLHPVHYDLGDFAGWKFVVILLWLPIAFACRWCSTRR